jgi:preprotein translocase subunit SecD
LLAAKNKAKEACNAAYANLMTTNVKIDELSNLLSAADDPQTYKDAPAQLSKFPDKYPAHKPAIDRIIVAHKRLMALGGGGDDLEDLQHLIAAAGVLEFRITVDRAELGDPDQLAAAINSLQHDGPLKPIPVPATSTQARWFEIDPNGLDNFGGGMFITANWGGKHYVLCFDDIDHALAHNRPKPWTVTASDPFSGRDEIQLPFNLDPVFGADYMEALTRGNIHRQLAILLDDRAMSAPTLNAVIRDAGIITFGSGRPPATVLKEANDIKQIMDAGLLPAVVLPQPVSVREIAPIANYRPFPWLALWTFGPLPVLALALLMLLLSYRKPAAPPLPPRLA